MSLDHLSTKIRTRFNSFHEKFHRFDESSILNSSKLSELLPTPEEAALFQSWTQEISPFNSQAGTADQSLSLLIVLSILRDQPSIIVETGVWHGVSSFYALKALEHNKKGFLLSLDLPPFRPQFRVEIGAAVPESLRHRWTLLLGPSTSLLRAIDTEIDIFVHDSEHTYRNMLSEYQLGWRKLRKGGLLLSDDIHSNAAFTDFSPNDCNQKSIFKRNKGGYVGSVRKTVSN